MVSDRELFFKCLGLPSSKPIGLEIERASGIYMYDTKGKEYIDLISGVSVSNIGHCHPKVIEAIQHQLSKYMHVMVYGEYVQKPQIELARLLTSLLPENLNSIYFVNSGSEAIEGAIKLAKRFTKRTEIIAFKNAYHGGTHGSLSVLGNETLKNAFRPLLPDVRFIEFNSFEDIHQISEKTACLIVESIQAEAGVILPAEGFLASLCHKCKEKGALVVLDDIQMGFGRTGKLFSFETFGFVPDVLTLAKGMGGGMPIGAFISSKEIMNTLSFEPELGHITTFGGHPVSCAAALASLKVIIDENLLEQVNMKGNVIYTSLKNLKGIKDIRQVGLVLGIDLEDLKKTTHVISELLFNGIVVDRFLFRPNAFRIAPPLIISMQEIDKVISIIKKCIK
jgi:acetylornithine/succinyldiaminopimelate/putrescine aminotransferase